jgi:hypothetical protein
MFGSLFELTASTPTSLAPTLGHYIPPNINDDIYDFVANPLDGRMTCYLEAIPLEGALPPDGINGWVALHHEDASSGERGVLSHAQYEL